MNRKELREKGVDITIHPVYIGVENGIEKKAYSFSIFENKDEVGMLELNPDFESYEQAEDFAVKEAITYLQVKLN